MLVVGDVMQNCINLYHIHTLISEVLKAIIKLKDNEVHGETGIRINAGNIFVLKVIINTLRLERKTMRYFPLLVMRSLTWR
jgi:hypothetical protein